MLWAFSSNWSGQQSCGYGMAAGALNLIVMLSGASWYLFQLSDQEGRGYLAGYAIAFLIFAIVNLGLFVYCYGLPVLDKHPLPGMVRFSFIIYAAVLLIVGINLLRKPEVIFPWPLNPDTSVIFGLMFIGDAFYFLYGQTPKRHSGASCSMT